MVRSLHRKRIAGALVGAAVFAGAIAACNYHWYPVGTTFQFRGMEIVSAVPAVKDAEGNLVPQCTPGGRPDGLILTMNLLGTQLQGTQGDVYDRDVSMRPGDIVKSSTAQGRFRLEQEGDAKTVFPELFEVSLECMEPYPDANLTACEDGVPAGVRAAPAYVRYEGNYRSEGGYFPRPLRETGRMGVAVMIDRSGSMKGFVDKVTGKEVKIDPDPNPIDSQNFANYASDKDNVRLTAVREFFQNLNDTEEALVFQFSELVQGAKAVCANPTNAPEAELRANCFGITRELIFDEYGGEPAAYVQLQQGTTTKGRTPLWESVADVYEFMKKVNTEVRHIVVIGDGPDTCAPDAGDLTETLLVPDKKKGKLLQQPVCSGTGYAAFKEKVLADIEAHKLDPANPLVHLTFVQFASPGYRERDPRQQEIACLTGGQYVFVNAQDLSTEQSTVLETALKQALMKVRSTLAGSWKVAIPVPALADNRVKEGSELAIEGFFKMVPEGNPISADETVVPLKVWDKADVGGVNNLDHRLAIRIPCDSDDDCAWYGDRVDACRRAFCDPETATCRPAEVEDGTACADDQDCTGGDTCVLGYCGGRLCPASADPCKVATVDESGNCTYKNRPDGTACDDKNACTSGEKCAAGTCTGGTPANVGGACEDGDPCTVGTKCSADGKCDQESAPASAGTACDDGNPCTTDGCDGSGKCVSTPKNDGGSCEDGQSCTTGDKCNGGVCTGTKAPNLTPCGPAGLCWEGVCAELPEIMSPVPSQCQDD